MQFSTGFTSLTSSFLTDKLTLYENSMTGNEKMWQMSLQRQTRQYLLPHMYY